MRFEFSRSKYTLPDAMYVKFLLYDAVSIKKKNTKLRIAAA